MPEGCTGNASHVAFQDGLCMSRAEMCFGFKEIRYFINIVCRNYQSGACCWFRPSGHGSNNLLSLGLKSQKNLWFIQQVGPSIWAHWCLQPLFVLSQGSPAHAGPGITTSSKECTVFFFFFPHLSPSFLTPMAVSSLRGSIRLTNWEFHPPLFQPPLEHACWLCCGALNPGIPPDPQPQGPPSSQGQPQQGTAPGWGAQIFGDETKCFRCDELDICFIRGEKK